MKLARGGRLKQWNPFRTSLETREIFPFSAHFSAAPHFDSSPQASLQWVSATCSCVTVPRDSPRPCAPTKVCCWWTPPSEMPTNRSWQPGFEPTTWRRSRLSSATTSTTSSAWRTGEVSLCRRCLWNQMFLDVVVSPNNNLSLSCWVWWLTESDELELAQAQHLCCLYLNITVLMVCKLQWFSSTFVFPIFWSILSSSKRIFLFSFSRLSAKISCLWEHISCLHLLSRKSFSSKYAQ